MFYNKHVLIPLKKEKEKMLLEISESLPTREAEKSS